MKSWKTPVAVIVTAAIIFAGLGGWLYSQQQTSPVGSVQLEGVPQFEGGGLLFGDTAASEEESMPTEEEVLNAEISESTELDAIEQDLENTVILDEDFSDL